MNVTLAGQRWVSEGSGWEEFVLDPEYNHVDPCKSGKWDSKVDTQRRSPCEDRWRLGCVDNEARGAQKSQRPGKACRVSQCLVKEPPSAHNLFQDCHGA